LTRAISLFNHPRTEAVLLPLPWHQPVNADPFREVNARHPREKGSRNSLSRTCWRASCEVRIEVDLELDLVRIIALIGGDGCEVRSEQLRR
jgi:hypothetical protein